MTEKEQFEKWYFSVYDLIEKDMYTDEYTGATKIAFQAWQAAMTLKSN